MNNKPKSKDHAALLAAINRQPLKQTETAEPEKPVETVIPAPAEEPKAQRKAPASAVAGPKSRHGKQVQFWLWDEDKQLIRELSAWLAGQGERPSDSLVIRSVLRMAKSNPELLKAYRQVSQLDGRLKQRKTA